MAILLNKKIVKKCLLSLYTFTFQEKVHDLEIQLTAIVTSEQHYSKQVKELKTELENEK